MEVRGSGGSFLGALPAVRKCTLFHSYGNRELSALTRETFVLFILMALCLSTSQKGLEFMAAERDFLVCGAFYR